MCPSNTPAPCNRAPFVSDSGCDRGSVDVRQFDDLPYCGKISPILPKIPPEVEDAPISINIPPPCACVNVRYKWGALGYNSVQRAFSASASFTAQSGGDCCEGKYETNFRLKLACPVVGKSPKKIKMRIAYGQGTASFSDSYLKPDSVGCTIDAKDMDINLNIPCPAVKSENGKLRVAVSYGEGAGEGSASVLSIDSVSCRVSQADANIRLNLKCPVIGSSKPNKIRVRIKYGPEKQEASAEYIRKDAGICQMEPLDPVLNLSIRCPVGVSGARKIKFKPITYSNVNAKKAVQVDYLSTNADTCEINPLDPEIQLSVPCPTDPSRLEIKGSGIVSVGEIFDPVTCKRTFDIHANAPTVNIPCIDVVTGVTWDGTDCKAITVNLCTGKEASYIVFTSVAHTGGC